MIPRAHAQVTFKLQGIVGKIRVTPHDRYVGKVVVVEIHVQPTGGSRSPSSSLLDPWYILFEQESKIKGLETGMILEVSGRVERSFLPNESGSHAADHPHLRPMACFFWGEQWKVIEKSPA